MTDPNFDSWDIERLRADTPAAAGRLHLDNAGAALMPRPVLTALREHIALEERFGGYVAQEHAAERLEGAYASVARLLGAAPGEIAFASSATDAWDRLFYSLPLAPGDRIVTAVNEYCSNFVAYLHRARRDGIEIAVVGTDAAGDLDRADLERKLEGAALVALSHVPSSSGQVNDAAAVGRLAKAAGVPFLLDACQSVGQLPVDVRDIGCDMLTGTARKFLRGPRGVGFLYVGEAYLGRLEPVMLTNQAAVWTAADAYELRRDARVFEAWERNVAGQLGLGAAVDYLDEIGIERASARARSLAERLRAGLADVEGIKLRDPGSALSAIVTFTHERLSPRQIKDTLERDAIAVQVASVLHTRLDLEARGIESAVRASPHYYNTEAEIDRAVAAVAAL